ncbi:MAG TPA: class I SAM-dependent methyltransferase [Armatimonadota bacterium]
MHEGRFYARIRGYDTDNAFYGVIEDLRASGLKRVLYPGCGLDVLPYFLAHEGLRVTAADISRVAVEYEKAHPPGVGWWRLWLAFCRRERTRAMLDLSPSELAECRRMECVEGGSIAFEVMDAFSALDHGDPYEAVVTRNLLEHYEADERAALLSSMHRRLRPGGYLFLQTEADSLSADEAAFRPYEEAKNAGFATYGKARLEWGRAHARHAGREYYAELGRQAAEDRAKEKVAAETGQRVARIMRP